MSLIEGIGDEVTHFFIALLVIIVVYIAWWSTNISEQRQYRTVLLLDRRRRPTRSLVRVRIPRRLSNHTETVTISEGTSANSSSNQNQESEIVPEEANNSSQTISVQPKPSTENQSNTVDENNSDCSEPLEERVEVTGLNRVAEFEERNIIETMDADSQNVVRQRRLAHFLGGSENTNSSLSRTDNVQIPESSNTVIKSDQPKSVEVDPVRTESNIDKNENGKDIIIKLKYINDDIRIVDGKLEELLGDFKKRHFEQEFNSNKVVKLIFNGQVLKQDRHTLQSCGLFHNCVVHCLVHQKRPSQSEGQASQDSNNTQNNEFFRENPFVGIPNLNNNNQGIDWDLGNFLFALVSFILLAAWYFRYVYAHLYTITATVGLIIITGVFSIVLVGTYFPDTELTDSNTRIRIARAERVEVQQQ